MHVLLATLSLISPTTLQETWVERPFNGTDLTGWVAKPREGKSMWKVGSAVPDSSNPRRFAVNERGNQLINDCANHGEGWDLYSTAKWGDIRLSLEVMVPQGSNSGIYVMGEYEVQVFDSYGKDDNPEATDMGAIYGAKPATKPRYRKPGEWSQFEIHFRAPRFDSNGKKTENARFVKVVLNGRTIHENVEVTGPTPAALTYKENAVGPLMLQGDHGPVAYRNIRVRRL
jgi:hypothetical protein